MATISELVFNNRVTRCQTKRDIQMNNQETCQSGLLCFLAKEVGLNPPEVRILSSPPIFTFARNGGSERVASRHGMPFLRYAPRFFQGHRKRAVAQERVRLSKAQSPAEAGQPIFLFALSSGVKRFLISIAQKLTLQYAYERPKSSNQKVLPLCS